MAFEEWGIMEIGGAITAITAFAVFGAIILFGFDDKTVETSVVGSELSYIAAVLPEENSQVSYQVNSDSQIDSSNREITITINNAKTTKSFSNGNDVEIRKEGDLVILS